MTKPILRENGRLDLGAVRENGLSYDETLEIIDQEARDTNISIKKLKDELVLLENKFQDLRFQHGSCYMYFRKAE